VGRVNGSGKVHSVVIVGDDDIDSGSVRGHAVEGVDDDLEGWMPMKDCQESCPQQRVRVQDQEGRTARRNAVHGVLRLATAWSNIVDRASGLPWPIVFGAGLKVS
jgi:hypothetical protein